MPPNLGSSVQVDGMEMVADPMYVMRGIRSFVVHRLLALDVRRSYLQLDLPLISSLYKQFQWLLTNY